MVDNYSLWERHDYEQEKALEGLPVCVYCKEPIQQEDAVNTNEGWICDTCLNDMRTDIEW